MELQTQASITGIRSGERLNGHDHHYQDESHDRKRVGTLTLFGSVHTTVQTQDNGFGFEKNISNINNSLILILHEYFHFIFKNNPPSPKSHNPEVNKYIY